MKKKHSYNFVMISVFNFSLVFIFAIVYLFIDIRTFYSGLIAAIPVFAIMYVNSHFFKRRKQFETCIVTYVLGLFLTMLFCRTFGVNSLNTIIYGVVIPFGHVNCFYFMLELFRATGNSIFS